MNTNAHPQVSKRHALALAGALAATVITAAAAVTGLSRPAPTSASVSPVVAPAAHVVPLRSEVDD